MISKYVKLLLAGLVVILLYSCDKYLPDVSANLEDDMVFTKTTYRPVLGRTILFDNNFNIGSSSWPLDFKLMGLRHTDGTPAPELTQKRPVKAWIEAYTGEEKSLAEIKEKREIVYEPVFQIREHSGELIVWGSASSSFIRCEPDPGYLFDIEVSNSGGRRYFRNMKLIPQRERPYEPNNFDPVTGTDTLGYIHPLSVREMIGDSSSFAITPDEIHVFIHKLDTVFFKNTNTITFRFLDSSFHPINPNRFNQTDWKNLVHGFDMEKTDHYVRYKVAYPIPLINYPTQYTNSAGDRAHTVFSYDRIGYGGFRETAVMVLDFAIYEEGNWAIDFLFTGDSPRFNDEQ